MSSIRAARLDVSPGANPFILGPARDLALFVLSPLWILAILWWARDRFGVHAFGPALLALGAVGHHLPGFIRAYTDPGLFRRFRARFLGAPAFFVAVVVAFAWKELHGLQAILLLWGAWHGAMQVHGFSRIYDAKTGAAAGVDSRFASRLDMAVCVAWFGAAYLFSDSRVTATLAYLFASGIPAPSVGGFLAFRAAWAIVTAMLTIALLLNAWRARRARAATGASLGVSLKLPVMAASLGFWWFAMTVVSNPLLGLLLFEIFHDVQYNALVWAYNRSRVARGLSASRVERALFSGGLLPAAAYAALFLGYGMLGVWGGYTGAQAPQDGAVAAAGFWTGAFLVSAFLHFYFDGFIWRVRDPSTRAGLGVGGGADASRAVVSPGDSGAPDRRFAGAWKWAFFVVPAAALAAGEMRGAKVPELERRRATAGMLPDSWSAHFALAGAEEAAGHDDRAAEAYARVLALDSDFKPAHARLAALREREGRLEDALAHYAHALELDPRDGATRAALASLLLATGRIDAAVPHLETLAAGAPGDARLNYLTAAAMMHVGRRSEAIPYLRRTLQIDPDQPKAWSYLGIAVAAQGDTASAEAFYRRALELDPRFARRAGEP